MELLHLRQSVGMMLAKMHSGTDEEKAKASASLAYMANNPSMQVPLMQLGTLDALNSLLVDGSEIVKASSAAVIGGIATPEENKLKTVEAGCIPPLMSLLSDESTKLREVSAGAIRNIANSPETRVLVFDSGVVGPLISLLGEKNSETSKVTSAQALTSISLANENKERMVEAGCLDVVVPLLEDSLKVQSAVCGLLASLSMAPPNHCKILAAGALRHLVRLFSVDDDTIKYRSGGVIVNLSANSETHEELLSAKLLPVLVQTLTSGSDVLKEISAHILANVCGTEGCRERVLECGALEPLVSALQSPPTEQTAVAADRALTFLGVYDMIQQQQKDESIAGIDKATFEAASVEEQKKMIGPRLHQLVMQLQPKFAPMITGVLLQLDSMVLLQLLESREHLEKATTEAMNLITTRMQQQSTVSSNPETLSTETVEKK